MNVKTALNLLDLYIKVKDSSPLSWMDIPELIPLRWTYLIENWKTIKPLIQSRIDRISDDDEGFLNRLSSQIDDLDNLILLKTENTRNDNPFLNEYNVYNYFDLFSIFLVSDIQLLPEEYYLIQNKISLVTSLNKKDFLDIRQSIAEYRDEIADRSGVIDVDFNRVYNRLPVVAVKTLDVSDLLQTSYFQESIKAVNYILFQMTKNESSPVDPFLLAKINTNNPDFDVQSYISGRLVAFHYGETLQDLANRYLGSRDKWVEIAIANGLMPPYIDETGSKIYTLNAYDNVVIIPELDTNGNKNIEKVYDNQPLFIKSSTEPKQDQRLVEKITYNSISKTIALILDGDANLSKYTVADSAYIRVYQQNTINSNFMILIPSNDPLPVSSKQTPWFLETAAQDEKNAAIDLYIDENKEIYYNSFGDLKLSYGLNNAVQAIVLKLTTEVGSLVRHPDFGLDDVVGFKNTENQQAQQTLVNKIMAMIQRDPRFDRMESLSVDFLNTPGTTILIKLVVKLAGSGTAIPITYTLNLG